LTTSSIFTHPLRYFIDANYVAIRGKPSATLAEKLEKDEKARTTDQVTKLGPEGLKKVAKELTEAMAENNRPIPPEVLNEFPVPDVKSISWINVQSVQQPGHGRPPPSKQTSASAALADHLDKDGEPLPFFVQYDHVQVSIYSQSNCCG
jgi:Zn-dependent M16 (insulinase) family peptidase